MQCYITDSLYWKDISGECVKEMIHQAKWNMDFLRGNLFFPTELKVIHELEKLLYVYAETN